ncbi:MAG: hypothetical protein ABIL86_03755 [candidate division WOR-3 bacterium]
MDYNKQKLTLIFLILPGFLFSYLGYTVTPARIDKALFNVEEITEVFEVQNLANDTLRIKLAFESFEIDENGRTVFFSSESLKNSIALYSLVNPEEFLIPPQAKEFVRFTFRMPEDTLVEYYGMLIFKSQPIPSVYQPMIQIAGEIGIPIYYYKANESIKEIGIESLYVKNDSFFVVVKNKGNIHARLTGSTVILTTDGKIRFKDTIPEFVILPQKIRKLRMPVKESLIPGEYLLKVWLDFGASKVIESERHLKVEDF